MKVLLIVAVVGLAWWFAHNLAHGRSAWVG
jgi:hypothetical protein